MIQIQEEQCNLCNACVEACPMSIFKISNMTHPIVIHSDSCIQCAHCLDICPSSAISHTSFPNIEFYECTDDRNSASLQELLATRHSIRQFMDKTVDQSILNELVVSASHSPSAHNCRETCITIIKDDTLKEAIKNCTYDYLSKLHNQLRFKPVRVIASTIAPDFVRNAADYIPSVLNIFNHRLQGKDIVTFNAPVLILFHGPKNIHCMETDAAIVSTTMSILAESMGLGTCYLGFSASAVNLSKAIRKRINIPEVNSIITILALGYPSIHYERKVKSELLNTEWFC